MTRFRVLAWHGIPAQVKAGQEGRCSASVQLDPWFTEHIDRVAMRDGLFGSDEYLAGWEWSDYEEREGSPEEVARAVADDLEAEWAPKRRAWEQGEEI
jgi:hypothetical protein